MAKATLVPKVWYAIESYENPMEDYINCYQSMEDALESIEHLDLKKQKWYVFKIEPLGEIQITRKMEYKFKK